MGVHDVIIGSKRSARAHRDGLLSSTRMVEARNLALIDQPQELLLEEHGTQRLLVEIHQLLFRY
jgi:predicted hotdog family 3-hydroxylacyl-ACP dehydratase